MTVAEPRYVVRLTATELEAATWCVNTLSSSWLGAPDGTAIEGLKRKLLQEAQPVLGKQADIRGPSVVVEGKGW